MQIKQGQDNKLSKQIILMNFFPGIFEGKRPKKATSFSNPLTGALYSNREYLKNCKNVPKSISDLDHMKQIKHEPNNEQSFRHERKQSERRTSIDPNERKRIQREIVAVHATSRMAEPVNKTFNESFTIKNKCKKALHPESLQLLEKKRMNRTFGSTRFSALSQHQVSRMENKKSQATTQPSNNGITTFNDIEVLILDLLTSKEDFMTKIIRINLQKYFRSFFKKQLSGHFTHDFLNKAEYYIEELLLQQKLDEKIEQHLYPIELFTLSSRMVFLNKLIEFESRKTATNEDNIKTMIRFYCVPSKEFRQSCLRDILLMLSIEVYEKFNCNRQQEYILLDQNGQQITEILQVKFSTKKLYLTSKKNAAKNFTNYITLLDEFYRQGKKLSFTQNIKLNFRQHLAQGKVDESYFNYTENYEMEKLKRLMQLDNAEHIIKRRIETHRLDKFTPKEELLALNERKSSKNNSRSKYGPLSSETLPIANISELPQKSKLSSPPQNQFWRISNTRISPESKGKSVSLSPQRTKSQKKNQTSIRASSQLSKEKLKEFLRETKNSGLNATMQKQIREQFRDLVSKNDIYDFRFNHNFKNRVTKPALKDLFVYFQGKSDLQIDKIMKAVKSMDVKLDNQVQNSSIRPDSQLIVNQKLQLKQQAPDNEYENMYSGQQRNDHMENSLNWEEFRNLRIAVGCSEPKQIIMNFVAKYLNFNQFGQLSKEQLFEQVQIILGEKTQKPTAEVIAQVIWSWFEANAIIQNGFIRRITLESWFEKYRIVYCMLISLIFGTNHKTILDLAYQVLA